MALLHKLQVVLYILVIANFAISNPLDLDEFHAEPLAVSHNLVLCDNVQDYGPPAYKYLFVREAIFWHTREEVLTWPESGLNLRPISCIKIIDQIANNDAGYAEIIAGGLRHTFVEIRFTSKWSKRMAFNIEIYTYEY